MRFIERAAPREFELVVREPATGAVLLQIILRLPLACSTGAMLFSSAKPGEGTDAVSNNSSAIAGRIDARPGDLTSAIESWRLKLKSRRVRSIRAYCSVVQRAMREQGWSAFEDFSYGAVTGYMTGKVSAAEWSGVTYNRNLTVFKSFSRHVAKLRDLPDFMADEDRAEDDRNDPFRPASLEEARALIRYAWMRASTDRKVTLETPLSLCVMFGMGLRSGEPDKLRWKHLKLDDPHPHVWWTKDIQKNKTEQLVPMSRELAVLLRAHRDRQGAGPPTRVRPCKFRSASIRPVRPSDPEAFVFGETISRTTFRAYLAKCDLAAADKYGKRLAPRSARKFYKTEMKRIGVDGDMVRALMRHSQRADERYFSPALADMAAAADRCPRLWPALGHGAESGPVVDKSSLHEWSLTRTSAEGNPLAAKPHAQHPQQPLEKALWNVLQGDGLAVDLPDVLGGFFESLSQPDLSPGGGSSLQSSLISCPLSAVMPRGGLEPPTSGL